LARIKSLARNELYINGVVARRGLANQQISWIASDSDVYAFFTALMSEHPNIDGGLYEAAAKLFGQHSDNDDEQMEPNLG
jgi:hypothetical protein